MPVTIEIHRLPELPKTKPLIQSLWLAFSVPAFQTSCDPAEDTHIPLWSSVSGNPSAQFGGSCCIRKIIRGRARGTPSEPRQCALCSRRPGPRFLVGCSGLPGSRRGSKGNKTALTLTCLESADARCDQHVQRIQWVSARRRAQT
jgi:hypothetical protein